MPSCGKGWVRAEEDHGTSHSEEVSRGEEGWTTGDEGKDEQKNNLKRSNCLGPSTKKGKKKRGKHGWNAFGESFPPQERNGSRGESLAGRKDFCEPCRLKRSMVPKVENPVAESLGGGSELVDSG